VRKRDFPLWTPLQFEQRFAAAGRELRSLERRRQSAPLAGPHSKGAKGGTQPRRGIGVKLSPTGPMGVATFEWFVAARPDSGLALSTVP
jgi:hypothetical protein